MDEVDIASEREMNRTGSFVERVKQAAASIPVGIAGTCKECGEHSPRLVQGLCAPCRDDLIKLAKTGRFSS